MPFEYTPQEWKDKDPSKPVSAARQAHIEAGIVGVQGRVAEEEAAVKVEEERAKKPVSTSMGASVTCVGAIGMRCPPFIRPSIMSFPFVLVGATGQLI